MVKSRRLISKKELLRRVPRSYPWVWQAMRRNEFPRGVVLNEGGEIAWFEDEVDAWLSNLPRQRLKGDAGIEDGDPKMLKVAAARWATTAKRKATRPPKVRRGRG